MSRPGTTVLIVDDDFHVARLHARYVDSVAGFTALPPVGTAEQARAAVAEHRPDLVLLDVYLPDGTGLDLLGVLDVDAIMLSAAAEPDAVRAAFRRGALAYLLKPFTEEALSQQLRAYARYRRMLATGGRLDQPAVDRARRALIASDSAATGRPRSATEVVLLEAMEPDRGYSASELATAVGVSRATAQRHLSSLAEDHAVSIGLRYGSTGRPEHEYRRAGG